MELQTVVNILAFLGAAVLVIFVISLFVGLIAWLKSCDCLGSDQGQRITNLAGRVAKLESLFGLDKTKDDE